MTHKGRVTSYERQEACCSLSRRVLFTVPILLVLWALLTIPVCAQEITPVDIDREKPAQPRLHYYDTHGNKLEQPVYFLAELDTVQTVKPSSPWPLYKGVTVGFNFFDAAMLIAGQSYASFDVSAAVSLHNWFFPT